MHPVTPEVGPLRPARPALSSARPSTPYTRPPAAALNPPPPPLPAATLTTQATMTAPITSPSTPARRRVGRTARRAAAKASRVSLTNPSPADFRRLVNSAKTDAEPPSLAADPLNPTLVLPPATWAQLQAERGTGLTWAGADRRALLARLSRPDGFELCVSTAEAEPAERQPLLVLIPDGVGHVIGREQQAAYAAQLAESIRALPEERELRRTGEAFRKNRRWYHVSVQNLVSRFRSCWGVYHFAYRFPTGQPQPTTSKDMAIGQLCRTSDVRNTFFTALAPVWPLFNSALRIIDPHWHELLSTATSRFSADSVFAKAVGSADCIWHGLALNVNIEAAPHRDDADATNSWVAMTTAGDFKGGDLVIPRLNLAVPLRPGDILLFRAELLEHFVDAVTEGDRFGMVAWFHRREFESVMGSEGTQR